MLVGELTRRVFEDAAAPAGEPEIGAELGVSRGDFLTEAGAAAGDEDALTFEEMILEHARSGEGARILG